MRKVFQGAKLLAAALAVLPCQYDDVIVNQPSVFATFRHVLSPEQRADEENQFSLDFEEADGTKERSELRNEPNVLQVSVLSVSDPVQCQISDDIWEAGIPACT